MDYRGQARGGDGVTVLTWWDGGAFAFEVRRADAGAELLTTGRISTSSAAEPAVVQAAASSRL